MLINIVSDRNIDILSVRRAGILPAAVASLSGRFQQAECLLGAQAAGLCSL